MAAMPGIIMPRAAGIKSLTEGVPACKLHLQNLSATVRATRCSLPHFHGAHPSCRAFHGHLRQCLSMYGAALGRWHTAGLLTCPHILQRAAACANVLCAPHSLVYGNRTHRRRTADLLIMLTACTVLQQFRRCTY